MAIQDMNGDELRKYRIGLLVEYREACRGMGDASARNAERLGAEIRRINGEIQERFPKMWESLQDYEQSGPGRPRKYGKRERVSLTFSTELIAALDARRNGESQSIHIEQELRKAWGMAPLQEQL